MVEMEAINREQEVFPGIQESGDVEGGEGESMAVNHRFPW